jgi:ribosomal protein S27AE
MKKPDGHTCTEECRCPECGARCFYAPFARRHACSTARCGWTEYAPASPAEQNYTEHDEDMDDLAFFDH